MSGSTQIGRAEATPEQLGAMEALQAELGGEPSERPIDRSASAPEVGRGTSLERSRPRAIYE